MTEVIKAGQGGVELVEACRQASTFQHNLRVECSRPKNGTVSDIMSYVRAKYHCAVRSVKRDKDEIIRVRFAEALLSDNDHDFCGKAKKLCDSKSL